MAVQEVLLADVDIPTPVAASNRTVSIPADFHLREVDRRPEPQPQHFHELARAGPGFSHSPPPKFPQAPGPQLPAAPRKTLVPGALGVLEKFVGTFKGHGFNTIFRPNNGFGTNALADNVLELNLTSETLSFLDASILGDVPNRGFFDQSDVILKGVPYTQMISDNLNPDTGKANLNPPVSIHFEQGLFMRTPATDNPKLGASIARMASIPHGTTINAQCPEPTTPLPNGPNFPSVLITPFFVGTNQSDPNNQVTAFANLNFGQTVKDLRIPANLQIFGDQGTITPAMFSNPNDLLRAANVGKNILSHFTFTVSTPNAATPSAGQIPGGGTTNTAFLETGDKRPGPPKDVPGNANGIAMSCTYWISTVEHDLIIPAGGYDTQPKDLVLAPAEVKATTEGPRFLVQLRRKVTTTTPIKVTSTQIQYSQNVTLNFGTLSWPHVSVATLNQDPGSPLLISSNSPFLAGLK